MRSLNTAGQALLDRALAGEAIPRVDLIEILTPVPQRWAVSSPALSWSGFTWTPMDVLIGEVVDSVSDLADMTLTLPGVTPSQIALAFDDLDGVKVRRYEAWVDPVTMVVEDALRVFTGECDIPGWQDGAEAAVLIKCIHAGRRALMPRPSLYTDDEQRRISTGDTSLSRDPSTDGAGIVWPGASFLKQG